MPVKRISKVFVLCRSSQPNKAFTVDIVKSFDTEDGRQCFIEGRSGSCVESDRPERWLGWSRSAVAVLRVERDCQMPTEVMAS